MSASIAAYNASSAQDREKNRSAYAINVVFLVTTVIGVVLAFGYIGAQHTAIGRQLKDRLGQTPSPTFGSGSGSGSESGLQL
jgi:hypothetical protein